MSKPLCGYCYKDVADHCCDKRYIDVLKRKIKEDRRDHLKDIRVLLKQLEEAKEEIRNFILLEIEELKNIRNHTRFPEKSMNRCNRRIKELELKLKEQGDD